MRVLSASGPDAQAAESLMPPRCYVCSLSSQSVVYKGLLTPWQFPSFMQTCAIPLTKRPSRFFISVIRRITAVMAFGGSRSARGAQRRDQHNVSNRRWLRAKQQQIRSDLAVGPWFCALEENVSDSASFDNGFEVKLLQGFSPKRRCSRWPRLRLKTIHCFRAMSAPRFLRFRCTASRGMVPPR